MNYADLLKRLSTAIEETVTCCNLDIEIDHEYANDDRLHIELNGQDLGCYSIIYQGGVLAIKNERTRNWHYVGFKHKKIETMPAGVAAFFLLRMCDLAPAPILESPDTMG